MHRIIVAGAVAAVAVVAVPGVAAAAGPTQVESPVEGATVAEPTPVRVRVDEECGPLDDEPTQQVEARLTADGATTFPGTQPASLGRIQACTSDSPGSTWGDVSIDPDAPAAFFGADAAPMCNGRWRIQARADGGSWGAGVSFMVAQAPAAPTGLALTVTDDRVTVGWEATDEPDLAGYRVERRPTSSQAWAEVETVGTATTELVDTGLADGEYAYRVVALRPDGLRDGARVAACEDDEPDLTAASDSRTATVGAPEPQPSSSPSPGPEPSPSPDGGDDTGDDDTSGPSGDDGTVDDPDGGGAQQPSDGSDGGTSSGPRGRVAPPPPPPSGSSGGIAPPQLPGREGRSAPRERYFGEDDEYAEELDFGAVDPESETETRSRTTLTERVVPQAVRSIVDRYYDPQRVLKPIATGLVLVAIALHVIRWTRESDGP